jgi:hypothetical protein
MTSIAKSDAAVTNSSGLPIRTGFKHFMARLDLYASVTRYTFEYRPVPNKLIRCSSFRLVVVNEVSLIKEWLLLLFMLALVLLSILGHKMVDDDKELSSLSVDVHFVDEGTTAGVVDDEGVYANSGLVVVAGFVLQLLVNCASTSSYSSNVNTTPGVAKLLSVGVPKTD